MGLSATGFNGAMKTATAPCYTAPMTGLLPPIEDEADNGDRLVEIETRNLEGINSGAPYYQATIRLDIDPPLGTRLQFTGSNVTATDDTIYTNASLGEVTLDLLAEDANWEPDIPGVSRVRFSDEDDCALEQSGCEPGVPQAECNSRIWSPIMVHELPERQADGLKTVYACFIDPAGNTSPAISASIVLDRVPPQITSIEVIDAFGQPCNGVETCWVNTREVEARLTENFDPQILASDARSSWAVIEDPNFLTGSWTAYAPDPGTSTGSINVTLPSQDNTYTVRKNEGRRRT